jgi:hypothetical protein
MNRTCGWKSRVKRNEKVNMVKKISLIDSIVDPINRQRSFIFTWRGGLAPLGAETLTKLCHNTTPNSYLVGKSSLTTLVTRCNRVPDVQTFSKPYLSSGLQIGRSIYES